VLNDHHADMRAEGFVSNRVFDVLAVGGRLLSDPVAGLAETVGTDLPTWRTPDDVARLARPPYDAWPGPAERRALAERIVAAHSFDARAATLLAAARAALDSRG
jgi:spore maturation protein CgeB